MTTTTKSSSYTDKCFDDNDERIFQSKLVQSIREATANIEKIRLYEIEEMENQDPEDVF
jgi:hypothetical protein